MMGYKTQMRVSMKIARRFYISNMSLVDVDEERPPTSARVTITACDVAIWYKRRLIHKDDAGSATEEAIMIRMAEPRQI